ncbi:MAG: L-glutamate gamma-semialdehyde dehydrogenase [Acholeplasmataceae bacterium]|nr:MAG: L-glutamate gamma-semialdehyde dehydrogenase [Acholeplasmataceae bacterium]
MSIHPYQTEPLTDFSLKENQEKFQQGLEVVDAYLGRHYDLVIDGRRIKTDHTMTSINPANHKQVIGTIAQASIKEADQAMAVALKRFEMWKQVPAMVRADVLFKAAAILRRRKFEFSALMTREAGKPWDEADADTAEAIDFLEYYGRQMLALEQIDNAVLSRKDIERNEYRYIPLGVGTIIAPWNFPLAILCGMTSVAIVTGNTVLIKPASTTQVIAYKFVEVLEEAGLPDGVVSFLPGSGREVGDYLVNHPKTRFISFTGSKAVGIQIFEKAAKVRPGQLWLKRVIAEMGGKDAIIVDEEADLDLAAEAIIRSAFGFSGQKCSACSRAIIHEAVYDVMLDKLKTLTESLKVGDPGDSTVFVGPVNDKNAFKKISGYIDIGKEEGRLITGGKTDDKKGYFIWPTIVADVDPKARLSQEEIFGPVLAVTKATSFEEAINIANNTEYGLTGAVISNNRFHLEMARQHFHVGNLYLNRKCTGAIVGYQPFGGFNMSGTNSKAGGPDYLVMHMQGKTVSESF